MTIYPDPLVHAEPDLREAVTDFERAIAEASSTAAALTLFARIKPLWQAVDRLETLALERAATLNKEGV